MKYLLKKYTGILSLLSFLLVLPIHYAYSQNVDELFGIKLLDNATNYISSEFIENNKLKDIETISGFWSLNITSSNKAGSPYFDKFNIIIDDYNKIHGVFGVRKYNSENRCLKFLETLFEQVEYIKKIKFISSERDHGKMRTKNYYVWQNDILITLQCSHFFDPIINQMTYSIRTKKFTDAMEKYYYQD